MALGVVMVVVGIALLILGAVVALGAPRLDAETEKQFQALLGWERDGIFPRIYGAGGPPEWYVAEKRRRGLAVTPARDVSWHQFVNRSDRKETR